MKKKYLAAILGVMMAATSVTVCGAATTETTTSTAESSDDKDTEDTTADSTDSDNSDSSTEADTESSDKEDSDKEDSDEADVTYGEVKSVEDGKITIAVGTMKEMGGNGETPGGDQGEAPEKPDGDGNGDASADSSDSDSAESDSKDAESDKTDSTTDSSTDDSAASDKADENSQSDAPEKPDGDSTGGDGQAPGGDQGEAPSMLDLTGDEMTVTVTDDTVITKESAGGPGGAPGGNQGEAPEKPDGDNGNGEAPEKPDGDSDGSGESSSDSADKKETTSDDSTESDSTDTESDKTDSSSDDSTASDKSAGDSTDGNNQGEAPEKPDGDNGNGQAPSGDQNGAPDGGNSQSETIELSDIQEGDIVAITTDDDGNALTIKVQSTDMGGQGGPGGAPGGQSQGVDSYESANTYDSDTEVSDTSLESTGTDENAALVSSGANVTFDNVDITRNSSDSTGGDNSSFYGVGAALLATDGNAYVKGGTVTTDAAGGAGLFAYGDGTVYAADTTIKTTQDTSGGIHAAGGGKLYAWDLNVETDGESAAAIRSDRGGGTMVVDGGTYTSNGVGSPAVYCTADIAVKDATLTANGSEAVCIEGLNSLHLFNCDLTGNMSDLSQNDSTWTVILYQSMSGDSEVGNSTFQMDGGTLTSKNGGVFYTTNTESDITLKDVDITYNNDNEYFLRCTGNNNERGWGESGANGADCDFTAISQDMEGNVIWDTISQLDFYMTDGSDLTGAIVDDESFAGNGGDGYCNVYVSDDSTWTVTGDSTVSTLSNAGTIVDDSGKTVTVKGTDGTVYVEGDSDYTITVDKYEDTADTSGSDTIASWSDYEVEKPDTL